MNTAVGDVSPMSPSRYTWHVGRAGQGPSGPPRMPGLEGRRRRTAPFFVGGDMVPAVELQGTQCRSSHFRMAASAATKAR